MVTVVVAKVGRRMMSGVGFVLAWEYVILRVWCGGSEVVR